MPRFVSDVEALSRRPFEFPIALVYVVSVARSVVLAADEHHRLLACGMGGVVFASLLPSRCAGSDVSNEVSENLDGKRRTE